MQRTAILRPALWRALVILSSISLLGSLCGHPSFTVYVVNESSEPVTVIVDLDDQPPLNDLVGPRSVARTISYLSRVNLRIDVYSAECELLAREIIRGAGIVDVVVPEDGPPTISANRTLDTRPTLRPAGSVVTPAPSTEICPTDRSDDWSG